ncbi:Vitamin B12 import ATP-binding protein BtuD [Mesoplasma sp. JKS002660]|uniref:ABC transporter ATP-binding protein n=1 Tax=Mesoplasma whartonense TaxID=2878854 RepID=UPI002022A6B9|nr:ABC transporter ATP-binding protein [Mesoplasma sp. JKS002660]MCL8213465.1 Vitamin B12 import ATP-binding protein BtuD [Mesoplasma sp. JKS002660]
MKKKQWKRNHAKDKKPELAIQIVNDFDSQFSYCLALEKVNCQILKDVNLEVRSGEIVSILGPSGSGKTTTLNVIAGFLDVKSGSLNYNNQVWNNLPTQKRRIGVVFQDYALYNNKTVLQNIMTPIRNQKDKKTQATKYAKLVGLEKHVKQNVATLSGGQKQRVALARAIVKTPSILLLDEPFSALDANLRVSTRDWVHDLIKKLKIPTLLVTHDQEEALSISDYIYVMKDGEVVQFGKPYEIYNRPINTWVAKFIGETNILETSTGYVGVKPENLKLNDDGEYQFGQVKIKHIENLGSHFKLKLSNGFNINTRTLPNEEFFLSSNKVLYFDLKGELIHEA